LDTGYDPAHITRPAKLILEHNYVKDGFKPDDASDHTPDGMEFMRNRGHGTGTLSLLAGNRLDGHSPAWPGFADYLGAAALAQIIPVRVADWVVRFTTGTLVEGFNYAREKGAHVLSMSMGGLSSQALVDAINLAYDAGLVMVTAPKMNSDETKQKIGQGVLRANAALAIQPAKIIVEIPGQHRTLRLPA
jgi:subtilisin family serine protease